MKRPECLHIPTLHEGEQAQISWEATEEDKHYIIERVFNESFLQAQSGYTWDNFDSTNEQWNSRDKGDDSWYQLENRTGKGQHWERLDYNQLNWEEVEGHSFTWQKFENCDINFEIFKGAGNEQPDVEHGRTWLELDEFNKEWNSLENSIHSWAEEERMTLPGISWESIDSRWLTFNEWEEKNLSFFELDGQKQVEKHRGMTDNISIGSINASYRIRSYDSKGDVSEYLSTGQVPIIPIFYRRSAVVYPVRSGEHYIVLMGAQEVQSLYKIRINLRYNPYLLELISLAAESPRQVKEPGNYPEEKLKIYSKNLGNLWFQSTRQLQENECFSGPIALVEFVARKTGNAAVSLY
ncbi:hypothetical protein [Clostridium sp. HBUAS56010]|uniref:hypothetical protein n=1 Tax=Clostridium sp. HBUAS56010 TaxID=2571127 RepID=UPI00117861AD|nr:hypothetical protein [Clostridium sp. HBUAS56010]